MAVWLRANVGVRIEHGSCGGFVASYCSGCMFLKSGELCVALGGRRGWLALRWLASCGRSGGGSHPCYRGRSSISSRSRGFRLHCVRMNSWVLEFLILGKVVNAVLTTVLNFILIL